MVRRIAETSLFLWGDRYAPASMTVEAAKSAFASPGVDGFAMSDQLVNFIPPSLWTPKNTPMAELVPDPDSMDDAFTLAAYVGYSFVVTNLDVATGERAAKVEHWYRHRTQVENIFKDAKLGGALRHLPSGYPQVNTAWMWAALLAASIAGWLHQLTATTGEPGERITGHGVRGGQAMIATLRHRLICVPARLVRHAGALELRLPPGHDLLEEVLARIRALPTTP